MKTVDDTSPPSSQRDQRRSTRYPWSVLVDLTHGSERQVLRTVDVCQHGLFVATDHPPRERFLVQLTIHLPDGPLPATAFVSRSVTRHGPRVPGVGLQLFALGASAKQRWDRFIAALGDTTPPTQLPPAPVKAPREVNRATFLLKLRDSARLLEFYEKNVLSGGLYLATPVIKEPGSEVSLIVIHPVSESETTLYGRVERVRRERPKGMEIKLHPPLSDEGREAFKRFVATGIPVHTEVPGAEISKAESLDIVIEEPVPYVNQQFDWDDVSDELIVDFDLGEYDARTPNPGWDETVTQRLEPSAELLRVAQERSEEISVDLEEEAKETGESVDLEEGEPPIGEVESVDLESLDLEPAAEDAIVIEPPQEVRDRPSGALAVHIACTRCAHALPEVKLGELDGDLSMLARPKPYWCSRCAAIVAVVRLKSSRERKRTLAKLSGKGAAELERSVPLGLAFEVAALASGAARCPNCSGTVRADAIADALETVLPLLEEQPTAPLLGAICPDCREGALVASLSGGGEE